MKVAGSDQYDSGWIVYLEIVDSVSLGGNPSVIVYSDNRYKIVPGE